MATDRREGLTGSTLAGKNLMRALRENRMKFAVVAGAAANTNIAIAGILAAEDTLVAVLEFAGPGEAAGVAAVTDRTATSEITSNGNIQCTVATNTSADRRLVVVWADKN